MFSASLVQLVTTRSYMAVEEKFLGFVLVYELACTELHGSGSFVKRVDPFCDTIDCVLQLRCMTFADCRPPTADCRPQTADCRPQIADNLKIKWHLKSSQWRCMTSSKNNIKSCESEKIGLGTRLIFLCKVTWASFPKCCWLFFTDRLSTHPAYH